MKYYTTEPFHVIYKNLFDELTVMDAKSVLSFAVLNPDNAVSRYAGSVLTCKDSNYIYRGYKTWVDLAQQLFCKMLTPRLLSECCVEIRFEKLNVDESFHSAKVELISEKYGVDSPFFAIEKNEEASFLIAYMKALEAVKISQRKQVLNLGINGGDEFALIEEIVDEEVFTAMNLVGIDYSASAIASANTRFTSDNVSCIEHDINHLDTLNLKTSDLIISIGTLQSSGLNFKTLFMSLIQNYLSDNGAIILGFPNARWMDGELIYGAKAPNYSYSEMSIVIKDIYFCKKYLQQHKFRVTLTGKDYIFLTATKLGTL